MLIEVPEPGIAQVNGLVYSAEKKARIDTLLKAVAVFLKTPVELFSKHQGGFGYRNGPAGG